MFERNHRMWAVFIALALTLACAPALTPSVSPTLDPASINTVIAETAAAAATQTAFVLPPTLTPTLTPPPTNTPTITPTATATFIFRIFTPTVPTPTPPPTADFACEIVSQFPPNEVIFGPGADFDTRWQVINTGREVWDRNSTDYRYVSGDKLHKHPLYDLSKTISPGGMADIIVDMVAPSAAGTYSTTWRIRVGKTEFCTMKLTIVVK